MGYHAPVDPSKIWGYINKTTTQSYDSVDANSTKTIDITTTKKQLIFLHIKFQATSTDSYVKIMKNVSGAWRTLLEKYADGTHEIYINFIDMLDEHGLHIVFHNAHSASKVYSYVLGRVDLE